MLSVGSCIFKDGQHHMGAKKLNELEVLPKNQGIKGLSLTLSTPWSITLSTRTVNNGRTYHVFEFNQSIARTCCDDSAQPKFCT